ncbi:XdhC family protein [Arthrobacter caoxuetaonis]|uniref:XdhC family protein n=1 Tax=Arthrobacter caoxuetaonis TaxID=2886935 RepID=A0A9X1MF57_9MICC|nr:XdhC/CoxI family protein [Arthrobacter caoxuetaonis]MCC3298145.1 XdhC family protein [Arthrobacter caoxuetaonis]USQ57151.1 XdhC family protein [Arthrobacter caoxuetaonis]
MLDHWDDVVSALGRGTPCAAATIIRTSGSVPRPAGTSMVVAADGGVLGSLTGGCVEAAVLESALEAIADGKPRTESFGYSDGDAFAVGLSCGGSLDVHILPLAPGSLPDGPVPSAVLRRLDGGAHLPLPVATGEDLRNALEALLPGAGSSVPDQLAGMLAAGQTGTLPLADGECGQAAALFLECRAAAPTLLLLGANDYSAALSRMGALLGYRVTVADGRPAFTDPRRFPEADAVVVQWPDALVRAEQEAGRLDARSVICLLSHDAKFDVPALAAALQSGAGYVGAMGSRRTHRHRLRALRNAGVPEAALARLHSPIGLDIGAVTPAEVALSVFAEVTAARSAASGMPLRGLSGPIHSPTRLLNHLTAS